MMVGQLPVLETYSDSPTLQLSSDEVRFLTGLGGRIQVRRPTEADGYILNTQEYACVVPMPSGRVLRSQPRIDVRNLFVMLAYAYGLPPDVIEETATFDELDQLLELVAAYFASLVESRLEQGLYRSYVEQEENLEVVRGRIAFAEDLRQNVILRQRTFCRFSELTWDVPHNQAIRTVAHLLAGWPFSSTTRARLESIDHRMDEVSRRHFTAPDVARLAYHRLNYDYEPMHALCQLFLREMSLSEKAGEIALSGFFLDMNALFERFVTEALRRESPSHTLVSAQEAGYLGRRLRPDSATYKSAIRIRPDIVLRRSNRVAAVLDCKFKRTGSDHFKHHDFYQVVSYCTSLSTRRGGLIYPLSELPIKDSDETLIGEPPIAVRRFAINLAIEAEALPKEVARLGSSVFEWLEPPKLEALDTAV